MPVEDDRKPLFLTDQEAISLHRALLEYDRLLSFSELADTALVSAERLRVRGLHERAILIAFAPHQQEAIDG